MRHTSSNGIRDDDSGIDLNLSVVVRIRAAMIPRWSRAIVLAALFSTWLVLISSRDDTWRPCQDLCYPDVVDMMQTMNLQTILKSRLAAGHSGQNKTTRRSEIKWSKISRYSASFEFLVALFFPDLKRAIKMSASSESVSENTFVSKKGQ